MRLFFSVYQYLLNVNRKRVVGAQSAEESAKAGENGDVQPAVAI